MRLLGFGAALAGAIFVGGCAAEESAGGGTGAGGAGAGGTGAGGATGYVLPQFVRGAALLNPEAFPTAHIVVRGAVAPSSVTLDGAPLAVTAASDHAVATLAAAGLTAGEHELAVNGPSGATSATLVIAPGSVLLTHFADVGPATYSGLYHDEAGDQLLQSYIDTRSEKHARMTHLDGAGRPIAGTGEVTLDAHAGDTVRLATAFGPGVVGALYHSNKTFQGSPATKIELRVLDFEGTELVAPIELNPTTPGTLGTQTAITWDGSHFDAVWADFEFPAVTKKLYWARVDPTNGSVTGPVAIVDGTYDGTNDNEHQIQDLQALSIACNPDRCAVGYRRQVYNALVQLSASKVFIAGVATADGSVATDRGIYTSDWDIQENPSLATTAGGGFIVAFAGTDTQAVLNEPDPCDASGRQKIYHVNLDPNAGPALPPLHEINDDPGQRYQATTGAHPDGAAALWEDEREKCTDVLNGQNRLAIAFVKNDAAEGPYLALPGSRLVVASWMAPAPVGPNYAFAWIDERAGGTILDPRGQVAFDTYWRE